MVERKRIYQLAGPDGMRVTVDMPVSPQEIWDYSNWLVTVGEEILRVLLVAMFRDGGTVRIETEAGLLHIPTPFKPEMKPSWTSVSGEIITLQKLDLKAL